MVFVLWLKLMLMFHLMLKEPIQPHQIQSCDILPRRDVMVQADPSYLRWIRCFLFQGNGNSNRKNLETSVVVFWEFQLLWGFRFAQNEEDENFWRTWLYPTLSFLLSDEVLWLLFHNISKLCKCFLLTYFAWLLLSLYYFFVISGYRGWKPGRNGRRNPTEKAQTQKTSGQRPLWQRRWGLQSQEETRTSTSWETVTQPSETDQTNEHHHRHSYQLQRWVRRKFLFC